MSQLSASGLRVEYHIGKYIQPYIGKENTHLVSETEKFKENQSVSIKNYQEINGKYYVTITANDIEETVLMSKLKKPGNSTNAGLTYEQTLVNHLSQFGLTNNTTAGCSSGHDFYLKNIPVEAKLDLSADFGQASLKWDKEWKFMPKTKNKFPQFTEFIESTDIINKLNKSNSESIKSQDMNLDGVKYYMNDHNVHLIQISSHGLYSTIESGLPSLNGAGYIRIRKKHPQSLTCSFKVKYLEKSNFNLNDINNEKDCERLLNAITKFDGI